jgi:hypothetical protein
MAHQDSMQLWSCHHNPVIRVPMLKYIEKYGYVRLLFPLP